MSEPDVILTALGGVTNLVVFDGHVTDSDDEAKTIGAPLPYVVYYSLTQTPSVGDSLAGTSGAQLQDFQVSFVGETREQADWARDKARSVLDRKQLTFAAGSRLVRRSDDGLGARRDDTWSRPDGGPLFVGADRYDVVV